MEWIKWVYYVMRIIRVPLPLPRSAQPLVTVQTMEKTCWEDHCILRTEPDNHRSSIVIQWTHVNFKAFVAVHFMKVTYVFFPSKIEDCVNCTITLLLVDSTVYTSLRNL